MSKDVDLEKRKFLTGLIGNVDNLLSEIDKLNASITDMSSSDMRGSYVLEEVMKLEARVIGLVKGNETELSVFIKTDKVLPLSENFDRYITLLKG